MHSGNSERAYIEGCRIRDEGGVMKRLFWRTVRFLLSYICSTCLLCGGLDAFARVSAVLFCNRVCSAHRGVPLDSPSPIAANKYTPSQT